MKTTMMLAFASALLLAVACKKEPEHAEGPLEAAGEEADAKAADVSEKAEEGAEDTGDAVEEAGDAVKDKSN